MTVCTLACRFCLLLVCCPHLLGTVIVLSSHLLVGQVFVSLVIRFAAPNFSWWYIYIYIYMYIDVSNDRNMDIALKLLCSGLRLRWYVGWGCHFNPHVFSPGSESGGLGNCGSCCWLHSLLFEYLRLAIAKTLCKVHDAGGGKRNQCCCARKHRSSRLSCELCLRSKDSKKNWLGMTPFQLSYLTK